MDGVKEPGELHGKEWEMALGPCPCCGEPSTRVLHRIWRGTIFSGLACADSLCREAFRYGVEHFAYPQPWPVFTWLENPPDEKPGSRLTPKVREVLVQRLAARVLGLEGTG